MPKVVSDKRGQARFEIAVERFRRRIDAMPYGPTRDAYVEGIADAVTIDYAD